MGGFDLSTLKPIQSAPPAPPAFDLNTLTPLAKGPAMPNMAQVPGAVPGTPAPAETAKPTRLLDVAAAYPGALPGKIPNDWEGKPKPIPGIGLPEAATMATTLAAPGSIMPGRLDESPGETVGKGVEQLETPGQRATGALRTAAGLTEAAAPLAGPMAVESPGKFVQAGVEGYLAGKGAKVGAKAVGANPEQQQLAEEIGQMAPILAHAALHPDIAQGHTPEGNPVVQGMVRGKYGAGVEITPDEFVVRGGSAENPKEIRIPRRPTSPKPQVEAPTIEGQAAEPKPVHHTSNDVEDLRASAERQAPKVGEAVEKATEGVPGAKLEAVRDAKDSQRIEDKAERQNVQPSQVGDIAAAKVTVPDQAAADKVLENLHQQLPVTDKSGTVTGEPGNNAVRQVQAHVDTQAPAGEPVKKAEVLIQTPEMHAMTEETHADYRKAQELRAAGKYTEAEKLEQEIAAKHETAEQAARSRQEESNAVRQPGAAGIHERTQEAIAEKGGERGRVERIQQGQEAPAQSAETPSQKVRQPGQAPVPPQVLASNLKDQAIELKDAQGNWRRGTVQHDSVTGGSDRLRRLRGTFDDGTKFDNVKVSDVRKPAVGVDFDGTLFTENPDKSIGKPIPERIASLKKDIAAGKNIVIESRRAAHPGEVENIHKALESVGLPRLPVTPKKTEAVELIGDKEPPERGVKVDEVATNANTPLPNVAGGDFTPGGRPLTAAEKELQKPSTRKPEPISSWTPPPELGAFPDRADIGKQARQANPEPTRAEVKSAERRKVDRTGQEADDKLFNQARKELGEDATTDQIMSRVAELRPNANQVKEVAEPPAKVGGEAAPVKEENKTAGATPVGATKYKFGNTQAPIHGNSEAAKALETVRAGISPNDLAGKGKEIGDGGNHVTVRYGIQDDETGDIRRIRTRGTEPESASVPYTFSGVENIESTRNDPAWPKGRDTWRAQTSGGAIDFYTQPGLNSAEAQDEAAKIIGQNLRAGVPPERIFNKPDLTTGVESTHVRPTKQVPKTTTLAPRSVSAKKTAGEFGEGGKYSKAAWTDAFHQRVRDLTGKVDKSQAALDAASDAFESLAKPTLDDAMAAAERYAGKEGVLPPSKDYPAKAEAATRKAIATAPKTIEAKEEPTKAEKVFAADLNKKVSDLRKQIKDLEKEASAPAAYFQDSAKNASERLKRASRNQKLSDLKSELHEIEQAHKYDLAEKLEPAGVAEEGKNFEGRYVRAALEPVKEAWLKKFPQKADDTDTPDEHWKWMVKTAAFNGAEKPAEFAKGHLFIKVPDDGSFYIPNNPAAIDHALKAAGKFESSKVGESLPKAGAKKFRMTSPKEFDNAKYIAGLDDEIKELEGKMPFDKTDMRYPYLQEQLKAARENLAEAKADKPENLLTGEKGTLEPGKIVDAAGAVGGYIKSTAEATKRARGLERGLQTLDGAKASDTLDAIDVLKVAKKDGLTNADDSAIYHKLENPDDKLSEKQQKWFDDIAKPLRAVNESLYRELADGGVPTFDTSEGYELNENYVHRVAKEKGGVLDRIAQGVKSIGSKGTLSKSAPQTKGRTYMALEDAKGNRQVVSIKGGQVTGWKDGEADNLGGINRQAEGGQFIDKEGNEWTLKQATTREIEQHTPTEYYHSGLSSLLVSNIQLNAAVRAMHFIEDFKNAPDFKEIAHSEGQGVAPKGWKPTSLPQLRGYSFEPRTAEVLDAYNQRLKNEGPGVLGAIGQFLRVSMLLNPIRHPANVAASWAVQRGASSFFMPQEYRTLWQTGNKAVKAVLERNQDFRDALEAGAALQSHREALKDLHELFFDRLADGLEKNESWATKVAESLGVEKGNLLNLLHKPSSKAAWFTSDVAMLQAAYEYQAKHPQASLKDSFKEVGRIIPEYRVPTRIADSRALSKLMGEGWATIFGGYRYGLLKSFTEIGKSALGAQEPSPGRTKAEEVKAGWDRLLMLGLGVMAAKMVLDQVAKKVTGDQQATVWRVGPYRLMQLGEDVAKHRTSASQAAEGVVTPAPVLKTGAELGMNREFYTGRQIYDPSLPWGEQGKQIGHYLVDQLGQVGQLEHAREGTSETERRFWESQLGASFRRSDAEQLAMQIVMSKVGTEAQTDEDRANHVLRREILDQLRKGNRTPLQEAQSNREITPKQAHDLERRARLTPLQDMVHSFSYEELKRVFDRATPEEKKELQLSMTRKEAGKRLAYWQKNGTR
jgi:hypothetical protein